MVQVVTSPPARRTFLTNAQKLQLKGFWDAHPELQLLAVADWVRERFGVDVGRATLYRIYHTPVTAFAGRGQRKKGRRVKFPELERDVLAYCETQRQRHGQRSGSAGVTDDELLRVATELRTRHGIAESDLKLSNGWLYRFKERHALRTAPQATGSITALEDVVTVHAVPCLSSGTQQDTHTGTHEIKRQRKPRATQRSTNTDMPSQPSDVIAMTETASVDANYAVSNVQGAPNQRQAERTTAQRTVTSPPVIRPLTYVAATAVESSSSTGIVNWTRTGGLGDGTHFAVGNNGLMVLHGATYQVNVDLQHSAISGQRPAAIFTVWGDTELLGRCEDCVRRTGDKTLSVLQFTRVLPSQTVVRVEYHAPGMVFRQSRFVLRLLDRSGEPRLTS